MSKKDYEAIAKAINKSVRHFDDTDLEDESLLMALLIVRNLATYFQQDNPNFDREKFAEVALKWR